MKVAFVQPFSLTCASGGGGGRILRGALRAAPVPVISCNTSLFDNGLSRETFREQWLPYRPHLGRIEKTRFSWLPDMLDEFWWRVWRGKLLHFLQSEKVTHLHVVPHSGLDFAAALWCANNMGIPIAISVHDHPRYCFKGSGRSIRRLQLFGQLWQSADTRFVISEELGDSLNLEFGTHPFLVITDGVRVGPFINRGTTKDKVHLYFMGLYHNSYNANFKKMLKALEVVGKSIPSMQFVLTLRCGSSPPLSPPANVVLRVLPFST